MTERGGERGGRSSAKLGPAEGRGRGLSPDAAGSEVGSGMTGLLSVPTRPAPQGRGVLCLRLLQSTCLGPPRPCPRAWLLPALPSFPVRTIFAMVLCWCHQHATLARARHAGIPLQEDPVPASQRPTQYRVHHPVLASSQQLRAPRGPLDARGAPGSLLPPAFLPELPAAPRATSLLQASTLGGSPAWNPPPTVTHPRGSPCWCRKLSVGRAGRPPRPRGASEVAAVGPSLCGVTPRRSLDVETGSHWPVEVTAGCHWQERAVLGSQGRHLVHTALSKCGAQPGPLGGRLWHRSLGQHSAGIPSDPGPGLDMRVRVRPAQHGLGRPKGRWEQRRSCARAA